MRPECEWTWNPGVWPYIKKCRNRASITAVTDDGSIELCPEHAQEVLKRWKQHGKADIGLISPL